MLSTGPLSTDDSQTLWQPLLCYLIVEFKIQNHITVSEVCENNENLLLKLRNIAVDFFL